MFSDQVNLLLTKIQRVSNIGLPFTSVAPLTCVDQNRDSFPLPNPCNSVQISFYIIVIDGTNIFSHRSLMGQTTNRKGRKGSHLRKLKKVKLTKL